MCAQVWVSACANVRCGGENDDICRGCTNFVCISARNAFELWNVMNYPFMNVRLSLFWKNRESLFHEPNYPLYLSCISCIWKQIYACQTDITAMNVFSWRDEVDDNGIAFKAHYLSGHYYDEQRMNAYSEYLFIRIKHIVSPKRFIFIWPNFSEEKAQINKQ